jgi:hypothetical protein
MVTWSSFAHFQLFHFYSGRLGGRLCTIKIRLNQPSLAGTWAELGNKYLKRLLLILNEACLRMKDNKTIFLSIPDTQDEAHYITKELLTTIKSGDGNGAPRPNQNPKLKKISEPIFMNLMKL